MKPQNPFGADVVRIFSHDPRIALPMVSPDGKSYSGTYNDVLDAWAAIDATDEGPDPA